MSDKTTFKYEGRDVPGELVSFTSDGEQWSNYVLSDGSTLKLRLVLMDVVRLEERNPQGEPIYMITAQQLTGVVVNPELKKKVN